MLSGAVEKASLGAVSGATFEVTQSGAPVTFTPCEATQPAGSAGGVTSSKFSVSLGGQPCAETDEGAPSTGTARSAIRNALKPGRWILLLINVRAGMCDRRGLKGFLFNADLSTGFLLNARVCVESLLWPALARHRFLLSICVNLRNLRITWLRRSDDRNYITDADGPLVARWRPTLRPRRAGISPASRG